MQDNRSFDERAATWDDDAKIERANQVADAIRRSVALGTDARLLEYGAGTGLVTQALRSSVGPVTLADTSTGMREVIAAKIAAGALAGARVWDVDLATDDAPDERFDAVVTVMAMHHIDDIERVLGQFFRLLDPGGVLCVVDLVAEDGSFHGDGFHGHHGFEEGVLRGQLAAAGFGSIAFTPCHTIMRGETGYPLFLAVATKEP